jgi:hypothetical protein
VHEVLVDVLSEILDKRDKQVHDLASHTSKTFKRQITDQLLNNFCLVHDQQGERVAVIF